MMDAGTGEWKESVQLVFEYFCERTPRSFVEQRGTSLVWNYKYAGGCWWWCLVVWWVLVGVSGGLVGAGGDVWWFGGCWDGVWWFGGCWSGVWFGGCWDGVWFGGCWGGVVW